MKFRRLLTITLPFILSTLILSCQAPIPVEKKITEAPKKDGVFIHISHGPKDQHRVLMGLRMATIMSADKDVLVYFDIEGVAVVLKDAPEIIRGPFQSAEAQIQALLKEGVGMYVCPSCLEASGATPDQVIEGVQIANKEAFFDFTEGRILTLDY
jgi:predicted peroxiredoxin